MDAVLGLRSPMGRFDSYSGGQTFELMIKVAMEKAMRTEILKLNKAGLPQAWINFEAAATAKAKGIVLWEMGSLAKTIYGGIQRSTGKQSMLDVPTIIAVDGKCKEKGIPRISNPVLFARDDFTCLYCGGRFCARDLSRDHVIPTSKGGEDCWQNCVTCCKKCNHFKNDRTPEQAGMELLAIPFAPNLHEYFYLDNRNVLEDQMDFLKSKFQNVMVA